MKTSSSRYAVSVFCFAAGTCSIRYCDMLTDALIHAAKSLNAQPGATVTVAAL